MPMASDELAVLTDAALDAAAGCQAAEFRVERIRSQVVRLHDARPETTADDTDFGMGVRVVADGAVGFAATVDVRPEEAADMVRRAREMARVTSRAAGGRVGASARTATRRRHVDEHLRRGPHDGVDGRQDRVTGRVERATG